MTILGLDVGSSSVKAGIVRDGKIIAKPAKATYPTHADGPRVEVDPNKILGAIAKAISDLGPAAKKVDAIGLSVMSPAWVAMDARGRPITPFITHQDRRSIEIARDLEKRVGAPTFLKIAGNLPFPGSISITTLAWYMKNHPAVIRRADLIGHLNTYLHRQLTCQRVIDPSNASFTGLYETVKQGGWSDELCDAVKISSKKLPRIFASNQTPGSVTQSIASRLGLTAGTPVMAGMVDTSAAMMLTGAKPGQFYNVSGTTDVLALCTAKPCPHEKLLTRALGVGRLWLSVGTLAAAGSALTWAHDQFFRELSQPAFYKLVQKIARESAGNRPGPSNPLAVIFEPYLAGERASIEQKTAAFRHLTLATTRDDLLSAVINALAVASGARIDLLRSCGNKMLTHVITSGGTAKTLHAVLHRDWKGKWTFTSEDEASLRGLSKLVPVEDP